MTCAKGVQSQQYYSHPQNHFWRILGGVLEEPQFASLPYSRRVELLLRRGICLWNVLARCERQGSLDAAIRRPVANDIGGLLRRFPSIGLVGLNGQWAFQYFQRTICREQPHVAALVAQGRLRVVPLVSSSPACAMANAVQTKTQRWKEALG